MPPSRPSGRDERALDAWASLSAYTFASAHILRHVALALALGLPLLGGCTTTHRVALDEAKPGENVAALNARASGERTRVFLRDGRSVLADGLRAEADSTSWVQDGELVRVATHEIDRVKFKDRLRGLRDGLLYGVGGSVLAGAAIGLVSYREPDILIGSRGEAAALVGMIGGALALPVALTIGPLEGHQDVYVLRPAPPAE